MKVRDISLMATGAIISVAAILLASTLFNPTKAQAQAAAAAPSTTAITITALATGFTGSTYFNGGGVITINDYNNRKVTIVGYQSSVSAIGGIPVVTLSTNSSFTY
ncbi:MAG: hypothetical protein NTZ16_12340 [Verrucomicrobia bacterium]|nr:hypothetical protein [Verrucomicrobiota bacterium]